MLIFVISSIFFFTVLFFLTTSNVYGKLMNPVTLVTDMLNQAGSLTFANALQHGASKPWDWIIQPMSTFFTFDPQYIAMISLTVWASTFIVILYFIWKTIKQDRACSFGLSWFGGIYIPLALLVLITNRISFVYYIYPAIGAICLGIGIILGRLIEFWRRNREKVTGKISIIITSAFLFLHIVFFILISPLGVPLVHWLPLGI